MKKIAIIGAGNVGICAAKELSEFPDMKLCGFVRRKAKPVPEFPDIPVAESVFELPEIPNGAIICIPSRFAEKIEKELLESGIFTVDSFDIHDELAEMKENLSLPAKKGGAAAVIGAGWDPGLDSVIRTLMLMALPNGNTYTEFGPGMSMGHSAAAREICGVKDALAFTIPTGNRKHTRIVYVVLSPGAKKDTVERAILNDKYFKNENCLVEFVDSADIFGNKNHAVNIEREYDEQNIKFCMKINNPTLTGRIMVSAMNAAFLQKPGAYFMPEISPCDFCRKNWMEFI